MASHEHLDLMRRSEKDFPTLEDPETVLSVRSWHSKYTSLSALRRFRNLECLVVASWPDDSFDALSELRQLSYLSILHLPKVRSLEPIGDLENLTVLRLATLPSWDSSAKVSEVESLAPIARLPRIAHVELFGVVPPNRSLSDLEVSPSLRTLRLSRYPKAEVARFLQVTGVTDEYAPEPRWDTRP